MTERPTPEPLVPVVGARPAGSTRPAPPPIDRRAALVGGVLLAVVGLLAVGLVALVLLDRNGALPPAAPATSASDAFAVSEAAPAPPLDLVDQDGAPFSLDSLAGRPVLLFFGYTHCPDVCPTTVGTVTEALTAVGDGPRAVFTSIDPERDGVAEMKSYLRYLHPAFIGLSGSPVATRTAADAWGVKYARIETGSAGGYAMAHTADLFLVDGQGRLRAVFPFGTEATPIAAFLERLLAETPPPTEPPATPVPSAAPATPTPTTAPATPAPSEAATPAPVTGDLLAMIVSSSVWSGGDSPVIFRIADSAGTPLDGTTGVRARVVSVTDGTPAGPDVDAVAIRPPGETATSYLASLDFPSPGAWRIVLSASTGATGSVPVNVLDPGTTTPIGALAPDVRTPTLDDVGGLALAVTTQPQPDLRLSRTSTADARAAGQPYVLVIDSVAFQVSPACGRAVGMVRYLLDRWTDVAFIHLEPFEYSIVTSEPVLSGDIGNPPLNSQTRAFGIGDKTWSPLAMPWIFVVDGEGIVRAKYTGIVGSADVDVIVSLIKGAGVIR